MQHRTYEEDGDMVTELDAEGIDYLIQGLEQLRDSDPGTDLTTPSLVDGEDGLPEGVAAFVLRRAEDPPS